MPVKAYPAPHWQISTVRTQMRRWEKEILKIIRTETGTTTRQTAAIAVGDSNRTREGDPDLARALQLLEKKYVAVNPPLASAEDTQRGGGLVTQGAAQQTAARLDLAAKAKATEGGSLKEPRSGQHGDVHKAPVDATAEAEAQDQKNKLGLGDEAGERLGIAAAAGGATSETEEDTTTKYLVEKLLRTSSSVGLAVGRPVRVKPPPVLMVEEDPHRVSKHALSIVPTEGSFSRKVWCSDRRLGRGRLC